MGPAHVEYYEIVAHNDLDISTEYMLPHHPHIATLPLGSRGFPTFSFAQKNNSTETQRITQNPFVPRHVVFHSRSELFWKYNENYLFPEKINAPGEGSIICVQSFRFRLFVDRLVLPAVFGRTHCDWNKSTDQFLVTEFKARTHTWIVWSSYGAFCSPSNFYRGAKKANFRIPPRGQPVQKRFSHMYRVFGLSCYSFF